MTFSKISQLLIIFITVFWFASFAHAQLNNETKVKLNASEIAYIAKHPEVTLASGDSFEPFTILNADGSVSGFDADLLALISERTGLKINLSLGNWEEVQTRAKRREFDGISTASPDESRKSYLNFSKPYTKRYSVVLVQKGNPLAIRNIEDLDNKRIALQKGNVTFERMANESGVNIIPIYVDTIHDMIKAVVAKQADFTILDESYAYIAQLVGLEKFIEAGFILGEKPYDLTFGLRNDHPELVSIIDKGLASVTANEMLALRSRWLGAYGGEKYGDTNTIPLSTTEMEFLKQQERITVCVTPDGMPFEAVIDGEHTGMSKDYLNILTSRLGLKTSVYPTHSWPETISALIHRRCDIATLAMRSNHYSHAINYTSPIITSPINIISHQSNKDIYNLDSLKDKRVTMVKDTAAVDFIKQHYPSVDIIQTNSTQQALEAVNAKQADAFIGSAIIARHVMLTQPKLNLKVVDVIPFDMQLSVAIRSDLPELSSLFQKAINLMDKKENQQIYNKWITTQYETKTDYQGIIKVSLVLISIIFSVLCWNYTLRKEKRKTAQALSQVSQMNQLLEKKNQELALLATTDELTKIWNRKKINDTLAYQLALAKRDNYYFGLILMDIDFFKQINDNYGHQVGDQILVALAQQLGLLARESDMVARWGGEEFLVICPLTTEEELLQIAERLRQDISQLTLEHVHTLTVSIGIASHHNNEDASALLQRADQALYQAKNTGRNRVVVG